MENARHRAFLKLRLDKITFPQKLRGALAQLGERDAGSVEVSGSIPLCSTKSLLLFLQNLTINRNIQWVLLSITVSKWKKVIN